MAEPFLGEIRMVGFNFAPRGWALCDGQILPINQNQSLYSLLGTTYGGDGRTTFALPDLRGRSPSFTGNNGQSSGRTLGQKGGEENVTLSTGQMPSHQHRLQANPGAATEATPQGMFLGQAAISTYGDPGSASGMAAGTIVATGGGQAHTNMQPYMVVNFCIATSGTFPSRN